MSKRRAALSISCLAVLSVSLAAAIALLAHRMARAQTGDDPAATAEVGLPAEPAGGLARAFSPPAVDEGAQTWDEMNADERAASDRIAEWAEVDHGNEVHQRWRRASREAARISKLRHAAYLSGLRGLEDLGVEP